MGRYLMAITVGPVQDFIAAARRTRDLWFGSNILSEVSRAAAKAVEKGGGTLIFPENSDVANVANVILAEVDTEAPETVARNAKSEAGAAWHQRAADVLLDKKIEAMVDDERWKQQVDDVIEVYSAWVPLPDPTPYTEQRRRVMRLLAGRKACRDFVRSPETEMQVRKSSLDGARESVLLREPRAGNRQDAGGKWPRLRLGLSPGEQLDVVGLTKRHGEERRPYPSVARIAADPWLYGLPERQPEVAAGLIEGCRVLERHGAITRADWRQFGHFPFDGSPVYVERHKEIREDADDQEGARRQLAALDLPTVYRVAGEPSPYFAILTADGDGMGKLISSLHEAVEHRALSSRLSSFAQKATAILPDHFGVLVYAGGDDVLAFVPVDMALACAHALHTAFSESLSGSGAGAKATLSVGIGIGHFMEPLEDLLQNARAAEKAAKAKGTDSPGNGLAIHFHTRGGEPSLIRGRWDSKFYERMQTLTRLYGDDQLADKAGYDLDELARKYRGVVAKPGEDDWLARALPGEAAFVLGRKEGTENVPEVHKLLEDATSADALHRIARELIVARRLGRSRKESGGRSPRNGEVTA